MIHVTYQEQLLSTKSESRCVALRAELEATRTAFHTLLDSVSITGWRQKGSSSAWTIGEIFVHLTWALEYLPKEVESARHGHGMFNLPKQLSDALSYWYIRWIARTATPVSIGRRYDKAMDATIALLDTIPDDDWKLGADFYGEGFHSVEDLFLAPARHFNEHTSGF